MKPCLYFNLIEDQGSPKALRYGERKRFGCIIIFELSDVWTFCVGGACAVCISSGCGLLWCYVFLGVGKELWSFFGISIALLLCWFCWFCPPWADDTLIVSLLESFSISPRLLLTTPEKSDSQKKDKNNEKMIEPHWKTSHGIIGHALSWCWDTIRIVIYPSVWCITRSISHHRALGGSWSDPTTYLGNFSLLHP